MYVIFPAHELFDLYDLYNTSLGLSTTLTMAREYHLCHLKHPTFSSTLKMHNVFAINLVKIVADFTQQLATIHEQQAEELQLLVETFRKRNAELRRERPLYQSTLFTSWETFLQEVEIDSQIHSDIASTLGRHISVPLLDRTFHQKVQSRKVFTHRESYETILSKTEELLLKCHNDYSAAYQRLLTDQSSANMATYYDAHNVYVQQLHAANAMIDAYHTDVLPQLMQELEEIYLDLSEVVSKSIFDGADVISHKAQEQHSRYDALVTLSKNVSPKVDISNYVRTLGVEKVPPTNNIHPFTPPQLNADVTEIPDLQYIPMLGNEVMVDRNTLPSMRSTYDELRKEISDLELKIRQHQEALECLLRVQARSLENCLYNKANELQEDICLKRFDLRMALVHSSAVKAQIELLACKVDDQAENSRDRKNSSASTGSMKNKWLKAFKNLKTGGDSSSKKNEKKDGKGDLSPPALENSHIFQEYTYKKITACDICKEVLRGHTRQGLRCKMCKTNVHANCQDKVGKCNPKSRLLRRQKSTSEIESRVVEADEDKPEKVDPVYQLLKQAGDLGGKKTSSGSVDTSGSSLTFLHKRTLRPNNSLTVASHVPSSSISAPHSPQRQKLNLRMKSLSLDSPESNEHVQRNQHQGQNHSSSHSQSPQSPVHNRRLLNAKTVRMSSVDLPDDTEKSQSSASPSPCPSPKPHRLLPTNLYVVLYNFKSRQADELDLKAGYTLTVIDTTDSDWWKGKSLGRIGYFPSKYVSKLNPGERPLQVTHNVQVTDGDNGLKLLRDQIVIQVGDEQDGMIPVQSGDKHGMCPLRYLQEI